MGKIPVKCIISAIAILLANGSVFALPQGGRVESGKGNLDNPAHIIQESQHLQTRWNSFDIAAEEQVRIQQPNAQASINIKVSAGGGGTTINGTLTANGRVSLENPAGIQFGENSVVNVGGLLASSAKGAVTSLGQVRATEAVRFQGLSSKSVVNVGGNVAAQEIIVESNGDIVIGNSAHFTARKQVLIGGGFQGKDSSVLNARTTDVKAAAQINAPYVIVWSDKVTRFLGRINAGRGFVEVSGKQHLIFPDISRATAGKLLLDPLNINIVGSSQSRDNQVASDGILRADEFAGDDFALHDDAINNYVGDVSLAATGSITVRAGANINKSNGSLTLSANNIVINATITISGTGNYLSFVLTGTSASTPFTLGASSAFVVDDLRLDINYTNNSLFFLLPNFAAPGRNVTITTPSGDRQVAFNSGFNLCKADNTGCGNLIINVGAVLFLNKTINTIRAKSIDITVGATQGITNNESLLELIAYEGDVSITATGGGGITSNNGQGFNFLASHNITFKDVEVEIGSGTMTLTAGVGNTDGSITLAGSAFNTLGKLILSQDQFFPVNQPFLSSNAPVIATYRGLSSAHPPLTWATLVTPNIATSTTPSDLNISDGNLSTAVAGKFNVSGGTLDLGSFNLTATTVALDIPSHITTITTTGMISITSGLAATAVLNLTAGTMALGGTLTTGSNMLTLVSATITAVSDLTINSPLDLSSFSFGSAGFDLTLVGATEAIAAGGLDLLGKNITLNGAVTIGGFTLTIRADNDLAVNDNITGGRIVLEAKAGAITFASSKPMIRAFTGQTINLTQADPYVASEPATFSTPPILNSANRFFIPSWGVCGINCSEPGPADLVITDGDLATALVSKFNIIGSTLDLGSFNLTATTTPLDIPSHILSITTTGTISIASGLTASAALALTAGTMVLGGTLTAGSNTLTLTSANPITASSALTISAPIVFAAPSLGSASIDLTLAEIISSSALELLGSNITLGGVVVVFNNSSLTVTADNDLAVNDAITVTTLALEAKAGGITFASTSTAITAPTLNLTQADPYVASEPATFSATPILNGYTPFTRPSWGICGAHCFDPASIGDLVITDGDLATALLGKFNVPGNILDLGSFNLTATTVALEIPAHIETIITTGTISIMSGLMSPVMVLNLNAGTFAFGGTFTVGNILTLTSYNPVMANSDLTISASLILAVPSLGSAGFDLTLVGIGEYASLELLGKDITLNGVITTNNNSTLTVTADNDIAVNANILAGTISLEAKAGGTTFASPSTVIMAPTINLTQADTYVVSAPANFSATPILNGYTPFIRPSWGVCGTNCLDPIVPADLVITDGDLATALVGKFDVSGNTLDLGSFNLTATTVALDIPSHITTITTTGMISITDGSTLAAGLDLNAGGGLTIGGSWDLGLNALTLTTDTGAIAFNNNPTITADSIELTQVDIYVDAESATFSTPPILNSANRFFRPGWGLCGTNCVEPTGGHLVITDGDLATALVGKFNISGGTLDLGDFDLTATNTPLEIPPGIMRIRTTGTISILGGLTASVPLTLSVGDTLTVGGEWNLGGNNALDLKTTGTEAIAFDDNAVIMASPITLMQAAEFPRVAPADFSGVKPFITRTGGPQKSVPWATGGTNIPEDLTVDAGTNDIILADEIIGYFPIVDGTLDLGSNDLSLITSGTIIFPANVTNITTTGDIKLDAADIRGFGNNFTISARNLSLCGAFDFGNDSVSLVVTGKLDFSGNPLFLISTYEEIIDPNSPWIRDRVAFRKATNASGGALTVIKVATINATSKNFTIDVTLPSPSLSDGRETEY